jgi:hypothetical protein
MFARVPKARVQTCQFSALGVQYLRYYSVTSASGSTNKWSWTRSNLNSNTYIFIESPAHRNVQTRNTLHRHWLWCKISSQCAEHSACCSCAWHYDRTSNIFVTYLNSWMLLHCRIFQRSIILVHHLRLVCTTLHFYVERKVVPRMHKVTAFFTLRQLVWVFLLCLLARQLANWSAGSEIWTSLLRLIIVCVISWQPAYRESGPNVVRISGHALYLAIEYVISWLPPWRILVAVAKKTQRQA